MSFARPRHTSFRAVTDAFWLAPQWKKPDSTSAPTPERLRLHHAALELVPKLADAKILEDWAGLRPGTPDALPILGATATPGYYVATGHFRDGILLAPITAEVMTAVIEDRQPEDDLSPFSPFRFL